MQVDLKGIKRALTNSTRIETQVAASLVNIDLLNKAYDNMWSISNENDLFEANTGLEVILATRDTPKIIAALKYKP